MLPVDSVKIERTVSTVTVSASSPDIGRSVTQRNRMAPYDHTSAATIAAVRPTVTSVR